MDDLDELILDLCKSEDTETELGWSAANLGIVHRMGLEMQQKPMHQQKTPHQLEEERLFNDEERVNKLIESKRDVEAMKDIHVRHFLLNTMLVEFANPKAMGMLWGRTIDKLVRRFCFGDFADLDGHRKDMYNFLMELLDQRPPVDAQSRWEWICIVTSKHGVAANDDSGIKPILEQFSRDLPKFFRIRPFEYKLFLLNLLEYDYAALHARQRANGGLPDCTPNKPIPGIRSPKFSSIDDLDNFPLAYLLFCDHGIGGMNSGVLKETGMHNIEDIIIKQFLMLFNPKNENCPIEECRLYARLVGLLLDVLLFVDTSGRIVRNVEKDITQKVSNIVAKVKKQHDVIGKKTEKIPWTTEKSPEWQAFLDMCGVPWIGYVGRTNKFLIFQ